MLAELGKKIRYKISILRGHFFKPFFKKAGHTILIEDHFRSLGIKNISLGHDIYFNHHVELIAENSSITIGNYVRIGQNSKILTLIHQYKSKKIPMFLQPDTFAPVVIEDDVWIGANCVILPGITVKKGAIVGAGAVVTKDVPAYSVVGGVPAKLIRKR